MDYMPRQLIIPEEAKSLRALDVGALGVQKVNGTEMWVYTTSFLQMEWPKLLAYAGVVYQYKHNEVMPDGAASYWGGYSVYEAIEVGKKNMSKMTIKVTKLGVSVSFGARARVHAKGRCSYGDDECGWSLTQSGDNPGDLIFDDPDMWNKYNAERDLKTDPTVPVLIDAAVKAYHEEHKAQMVRSLELAFGRKETQLDTSGAGLMKLWQQAQDAATETVPAPFQFARMLLNPSPQTPLIKGVKQ